MRPARKLLFTNSIVGGVTAWASWDECRVLTASARCRLLYNRRPLRPAREPAVVAAAITQSSFIFVVVPALVILLCLDGWFAHANCCIAGQSAWLLLLSRRTQTSISPIRLLATETLRRHLLLLLRELCSWSTHAQWTAALRASRDSGWNVVFRRKPSTRAAGSSQGGHGDSLLRGSSGGSARQTDYAHQNQRYPPAR